MASFPLPKGYQRLDKFPIDDTEIFSTLGALEIYAVSPAAYAGQKCSVVDTINNTAEIYVILPDGTLSAPILIQGDVPYSIVQPTENAIDANKAVTKGSVAIGEKNISGGITAASFTPVLQFVMYLAPNTLVGVPLSPDASDTIYVYDSADILLGSAGIIHEDGETFTITLDGNYPEFATLSYAKYYLPASVQEFAFTQGLNNINTGNLALVVGENNTNIGDNSVVTGSDNNIIGDNAGADIEQTYNANTVSSTRERLSIIGDNLYDDEPTLLYMPDTIDVYRRSDDAFVGTYTVITKKGDDLYVTPVVAGTETYHYFTLTVAAQNLTKSFENFIQGVGTLLSGSRNHVVGSKNYALGTLSSLIGIGNTSSPFGVNTLLGYHNVATQRSTLIGQYNTGNSSTCIGISNFGTYGIIIGDYNIADQGTIIGISCKVYGIYSTAIGTQIRINDNKNVGIGRKIEMSGKGCIVIAETRITGASEFDINIMEASSSSIIGGIENSILGAGERYNHMLSSAFSEMVNGTHNIMIGCTNSALGDTTYTTIIGLDAMTTALQSNMVYLPAIKLVIGTVPPSPEEATMYFDSTIKKLLIYNGTKWIAAGGHLIKDNGIALAGREGLNFKGAVISDDEPNDTTDIELRFKALTDVAAYNAQDEDVWTYNALTGKTEPRKTIIYSKFIEYVEPNITADKLLFSIIPANTSLVGLRLVADGSATTDTIKIGTTAGGSDIAEQVIAANFNAPLNLVTRWFDETNNTDIYISGITAGSLKLYFEVMNGVVSVPVSGGTSKWDDATGGINYSGGNVGVGVAVPTAKLHVLGTFKVAATADLLNALNVAGAATFTGAVVATTRIAGDSTLNVATTAFVQDAISGSGGGTVSSVGMAVPVGLSVTGSPITTSGVFTIDLQSGYSIPTTIKQNNWDIAYTHSQLIVGNPHSLNFTDILGTLNHTSLDSIGTNTHDQIDTHIVSTANPHGVDKDDVALGNVLNVTQIPTTEKAANNGVATLDSGGKVPISQLPSSIMEYHGTWNVLTNVPALADGTGNAGDVYLCSNSGTRDLGSGDIDFTAGDWVVYSGTIWESSINSANVISVNNQTGIVVLNTSHIVEVTNLYYTEARVTANAAVALNTAKTSFPGFGTLLNDYAFTDNSTNWNTAYTHSQLTSGNPHNVNIGVIDFNSRTGSVTLTKADIEGVLTGVISTHSHSGGGTVTSVGMTAPIGFDITGSPITTAGTLVLSFADGYSLPTITKQGQWDSAYSWGDHSTEGYLTSFTETDPVFLAHQAYNITSTDITNLSNLSGINTGDQDLSALALKSNVLELDNTTSFTPDADYEPATKKYVDDNAGGAVDSVNGETGVVILDADDIEETTRKYVTAADITVLGNTSGTNTGDQDISEFITASSTNTLTNKSGSNSQWTNDENYLVTKADVEGVLTGVISTHSHSGGGGTVTSVGMTVPTGLDITGSPITTSGTLALSLTSGYAISTITKQGQWDTAYNWGDHEGLYSLLAHTHTFASLTSKPTTLNEYGIIDAQALDADLTAIAGITATVGLLKKTAANTWSLDTNTYLTSYNNEYANSLDFNTGTGILTIGRNIGADLTKGLDGRYLVSVSESDLSLTDITTANSSTSKHGLLPKLDGSTTKYLRADGSWQTVSVPVKATGAELNTGTNDTKFATAKALVDSTKYGKRQTSIGSDTTPNPTGNYAENEYYLTALSGAANFQVPSGTPANGNSLIIRIKDNGIARALTWNAVYRVVGAVLPTTTVASKTIYVGCIYNSAESKWDVVAVKNEA